MNDSEQLDFILHKDWHTKQINSIGAEPWLTVYSNHKTDAEDATIYSALIPNVLTIKSLSDTSWDFSIGDGFPGCTIYPSSEGEQIIYHQFGNDEGIEPFIICRSFHGLRPTHVEILEEFRLFHNLFFDQNSSCYVKLDDSGSEQTVVKVTPEAVTVRLKEIRQFLAIKEMHLAVYFDIVRFSKVDIALIAQEQRETEVAQDLTYYTTHVSEGDFFTKEDTKTFSRLLGKKLIPGFSKSKSGMWPYDDRKEQFEDFIIGFNEDGDPKNYTSDPNKLGNYFGANPNAPHYLAPVFFRPEVLAKYYANPGKYTIEDGYLRCGGLWGMQIDNNHPKYVVVFLGDLGRDLPHSEQLYWRSFNILPEGEMSSVNYRRSFLAEFADPEKADLFFKYAFEEFQQKWHSCQGWYLFKPFSPDDQYLFETLHIPLTNDHSELDGQVLALTKTIIDSLNEENIEIQIGGLDPNLKGGISKLERFLATQSFPNYQPHIKFLRNLQSLRSTSVGHRKGQNYKKIAKEFGIGEKDIREIFENILKNAAQMLKDLSDHFLP